MTQLFSNNAATALSAAISDTDTTISVDDATRFPSSLGTGEFFLVTAEEPSADKREIMKVTGVTGSDFTVERAQEGFAAQSFAQGALVEMRLTRGTLLASPEISDEDVLGTRMKLAVVTSLPPSPATDTVYFILG